jgi:hypothetical protein
MNEREKIKKRDAVYDLIKHHVGNVIDCPPGLCVGRGTLSPKDTWLFEKILDIFGIGYEDRQ